MTGQARERSKLERAAGALTLLTVLAAFGLSAMTLSALGVKYDQAGGNFLTKLHPATWIGSLAFAANVMWRPDRFAYLAALPRRFPGVAYFVTMWVVMIVFASLAQHAPVTPLIDTFFCAVVFMILYTDADDGTRATVRIALHAFLFVNACIGIGEFVSHKRLTPFVTGGKEILHDIRSTALMGHPLVNAATSAGYILMMFFGGDRAIGWGLRVVLILVQAAALVCFGGRTAMVVCGVLIGLGAIRPVGELFSGRRFDIRMAVLADVALPLAAAAIVAAIQSGRLDGILERFVDDKGSAQARVVMFQLFDHFSLEELLLGPDPQRLATLQNTFGIEYGIENSWLGFVFQYGLLASLFFISGFLTLLWELWRRSKPAAVMLVLFLLVQVSSAAGISVKSFMFNQFAIMMLSIFGAPRPSEFAAESPRRSSSFAIGRA